MNNIEWVSEGGKLIARVTRRSLLTGKDNTRDLDVTPEQIGRWQGGQLIQNAMPELSADDREFLMTGLTADDWRGIFPPETEGE